MPWHWPAVLALGLLPSAALGGSMAGRPKTAEETVLFPSRRGGVRFRAWNMTSEVRGERILLNADQQGAPWAGMMFSPAAEGRGRSSYVFSELGQCHFRIVGTDRGGE